MNLTVAGFDTTAWSFLSLLVLPQARQLSLACMHCVLCTLDNAAHAHCACATQGNPVSPAQPCRRQCSWCEPAWVLQVMLPQLPKRCIQRLREEQQQVRAAVS